MKEIFLKWMLQSLKEERRGSLLTFIDLYVNLYNQFCAYIAVHAEGLNIVLLIRNISCEA